jgi:opacity protein-like surface antigen
MKRFLAAIALAVAFAVPALADPVVVGVPWKVSIQCDSSHWYTNSPNNTPAADFWSISLPPAMWQVNGNYFVIPLPGAGQTQTITETHMLSSDHPTTYWGGSGPPTVEPSPAGGSVDGSHAVRIVNQGEAAQLGTRYFDFRSNAGDATVYVQGVFSWSWTGSGSQPPMATCGTLWALPTALP